MPAPAPKDNIPDIDVDDEEEEEEGGLEWLLGFVEPLEDPSLLLRHRFPSKVGGRPAWLNPRDLPTREQLTCSFSGKPLRFLMQVYAPPPEEEVENIDAFHRTVFLFVSPEGDKLDRTGAVRALRCQLPRQNPFYSYDPPSDSDRLPPTSQGPESGRDPWRVSECEEAEKASSSGTAAAGTAAAGTAAAGKKRDRVRDRVRGAEERQKAGPGEEGEGEIPLFPEMELQVEPEDEFLEADDDSADPQVQRLLQQYEAQVAEEGEVTEEDLPAEVLDQVEGNLSKERKHYVVFQTRVDAAPDQCLRYCFREGAVPLCPSPAGIPGPESIPPCPRCGGPRIFEFQVMPQLLNYLELDEEDPSSLDWGTIAVYSCKASCSVVPPVREGVDGGGSAYVEEHVWVQPSA